MAKEDAARFFDALTDPAIIQTLQAAEDLASFAALAVQAGKGAGIVFTESDVENLLAAAQPQPGELRDAELEAVAGGIGAGALKNTTATCLGALGVVNTGTCINTGTCMNVNTGTCMVTAGCSGGNVVK